MSNKPNEEGIKEDGGGTIGVDWSSDKEKAIGVEWNADGDVNWDEEDIEAFVEEMEKETRENPDPPIAGIVWAGIALGSLMIYGVYEQHMQVVMLTAILLAILALGNKAIR